MSNTCKARTNAGESCKAVAVKKGFCALHADPRRAAELGRKSGKVRRSRYSNEQPQSELAPPQTVQEVRNVLGQFISDVRAGRLDPKLATTLGYLATVLLKSIEVVNVEERLAVLEKVLRTGVRKDQQGT